jgi:hypothetical protein
MGSRVFLALVVVVIGAGCSDAPAPAAPTPPANGLFNLSVEYVRAVIPSSIPRDRLALTGCQHHYGPLNMQVRTDWGGGGGSHVRLSLDGDRRYVATLRDVRVGGHYLYIVDVSLCGYPGLPYVTSGVRVNGIELRRVVSQPQERWLQFDVTPFGGVVP